MKAMMMMMIFRGILFTMVALLAMTTTNAFSPLYTTTSSIGGQQHHQIRRLLIGTTTKPSLSSSVALSASILDTTTTTATTANDKKWIQLEQVASTHKQEKGRIMFHYKELVLQNEDLAAVLTKEGGVNFHVPSTWEEAITIFWNQPQPQLLALAAIVSVLCRFSLVVDSSPLGIADLFAIGLTKIAWDIQEWSYHYRNFHGNSKGDGRSYFPFQYHNHHHDLPYYHVAMEPTEVCTAYAVSVTILAVLTYVLLEHFGSGAGGLLFNNNLQQHLPSVVVTTHSTFLVSSIHYLWVHYLAHSKVPLKGDLQSARSHHIQHHIDHTVNLNMAFHTIDTIVGTTTTTTTKK